MLINGKFEMTWFVGNQLPETYENVVITPVTDETSELGIFLFNTLIIRFSGNL